MSHDLFYQILDHPAPDALLRRVQEVLAGEAEARAAFREWLKPDIKAEFINGEIIMHSPAKRRHNQATKHTVTLLDLFVSSRQLGEVAVEKALVELDRSDVEPDVCYWAKTTSEAFTDNMNVYPPPDLVVEVLSKSTEARDRGVKKEAYEAAGVTEYWLVDPVKHTLEQYVLAKDKHGRVVYHLRDTFGIEQSFTSEVLVGLTLPLRALFDPETRDTTVRVIMLDSE